METEKQMKSFLPKVGLYMGIIGAVSLLFFCLIFLEDWTGRYTYLWYIIPVPVILLFIANKFSLTGGLLLILLGIAILVFDINNNVGNPGQIAGKGLGYTIVCVSLPFVVSGLSYVLYWFKQRKHQSYKYIEDA